MSHTETQIPTAANSVAASPCVRHTAHGTYVLFTWRTQDSTAHRARNTENGTQSTEHGTQSRAHSFGCRWCALPGRCAVWSGQAACTTPGDLDTVANLSLSLPLSLPPSPLSLHLSICVFLSHSLSPSLPNLSLSIFHYLTSISLSLSSCLSLPFLYPSLPFSVPLRSSGLQYQAKLPNSVVKTGRTHTSC